MPVARQLLSAERLVKAYGGDPVLDGISLGLAEGDRVGIVGANGTGKSTLLNLLAKREQPDAGAAVWTTGLHVGVLGQTDELDPSLTIRQEVVGGRADHEWAADRRLRDILEGTLGGIDPARFPQGLDTVIGPLSGGERRRIALAKLLLESPELLLLDEPTNHLDLEGVDWLASHLAARRGALAVVTHDRWFLDTVCTRTWEIERGALLEHDGGYAAYVLARAERERVAVSAESRRRNLVRKELAWLRRGAPARTRKSKFRVEEANTLIADVPPPRDRAELLRFATARLGRSVLDVERASVELDGRTLLRRITWRLGPGDRVGLVGVNGSGKTTLLRLLAGELEAASGDVRTGTTVRIGVLTQELTELDGDQRVLESLEAIRRRAALGDGYELTASQLAERFGFRGNRQWTFVRDLSGGERRRLQLMRLMLQEPNVLLLDEPTNDLDIDTLTALEDLLDGWPGTLVVVSHDRYFIERACDDVYALAEGGAGIVHLPGGVAQYLEQRRAAEQAALAAAPAPARPSSAGVGGRRREAQKEAGRLERELERLARAEAGLHEQLAANATDYAKVAELDQQLRTLLAERERVEEAWLEAAELLG